MKLKYGIDLHKGATALVVPGLMYAYGNFSLGPMVYLALHGTYGVLWLLKSQVFPDPAWEAETSVWKVVGAFAGLLTYWVPAWLLVSSGAVPPPWLVALAVSMNIIGVFAHFCSDAQKFYTLRVQRGLITDGFFARSRNMNYLGEMLIYGSFALISMHWISWGIMALWWGAVFLPNMLKKDRSMSRYPQFAAYTRRSGLLLPKLFAGRDSSVDPASRRVNES